MDFRRVWDVGISWLPLGRELPVEMWPGTEHLLGTRRALRSIPRGTSSPRDRLTGNGRGFSLCPQKDDKTGPDGPRGLSRT